MQLGGLGLPGIDAPAYRLKERAEQYTIIDNAVADK